MNEKTEKLKVGISLDPNLIRRIDSYAKANYLNRSTFITLACNQYLDSMDVANALKNVSVAMMNISKNTNISDEDKRQLDEFQKFAEMISQK